MWQRRGSTEITCIACGDSVARGEAREYDKLGDRWDREAKTFEHLCKPCHRELCNQPRDGLEGVLADIDAGTVSRSEFLRRYREATTDSGGPECSGDHDAREES